MKRDAFTLVELITAMVIASIIMLCVALLFVANVRFYTMIQDDIAVAREAEIAMDHMMRVLRFAGSVTSYIEGGVGAQRSVIVGPCVEGRHLVFIDNDTAVGYYLNSIDRSIRFRTTAPNDLTPLTTFPWDPSSCSIIATNITHLTATWADPMLEIRLTAQKGNSSISLKNTIRCLGNT